MVKKNHKRNQSQITSKDMLPHQEILVSSAEPTIVEEHLPKKKQKRRKSKFRPSLKKKKASLHSQEFSIEDI